MFGLKYWMLLFCGFDECFLFGVCDLELLGWLFDGFFECMCDMVMV